MPDRRKPAPKEREYPPGYWKKWFEGVLKIENMPLKVVGKLKEYAQENDIDLLHMDQRDCEKIREKCVVLVEENSRLLKTKEKEKDLWATEAGTTNDAVENQGAVATRREINKIIVKDTTTAMPIPREIRRRCWKIIKAKGRICRSNMDQISEWLAREAGLAYSQMAKRIIEFYVTNRNLKLVRSNNGDVELMCCAPRLTVKPIPADNKMRITSRESTLNEICNSLMSAGFSIQKYENCLFASRQREAGPTLRLFIAVQKKEDIPSCYFKAKTAMIFDVSKFQHRLISLIRWWLFPKRKPVGELNTDVLTAFGWHVYLNEDTRQENLMAAANELGETHVAKILLWLKNSWPNNPVIPEEYSFNVCKDYNWFRSNIGENAYYFRLKNELSQRLFSEYRRLVGEGRIEAAQDPKAIERFFLVTY